MGTTAEKLSYLNGTKNVLKTNLINKSVTLTGNETFRELANKVNDIQIGGGKASPEYVSFQNYTGTSLDLSWLDTSNMTDMSKMFYYCEKVKRLDVSEFNTVKVTNMSNVFNSCRALTSLDVSNFNTSNVASMSYMFNNCQSLTSLDVSNFDTSNVTDMGGIFQECRNLTSLDVSNFDMSKVTNIRGMFNVCKSLTSLDVSNFGIIKGKDMSYMFQACSSLKNIIGTLDMQNVTNASGMFSSCSALEEVHIHNLGANLSLSDSPNLTHDCLVELINNLQTVTSTKTLTLGSTNLAKLTDAEKQVATDKGWTLA